MVAQKIQYVKSLIDSSSPEWVNTIFDSNDFNVYKLDSAFYAYYREHTYEKNTITQWFKKWRREIEPYTQLDGSVRFPTTEELLSARMQFESLRLSTPNASKEDGNRWNCLGPFQTWTLGQGQIPVSWQANIYALAVAPSDPNVLYAGGEAGGVFMSTDKGLSWNFASGNASMVSITSLAVDPVDPLHVLAADGNTIYQTHDGGQQWEIIREEAGLGVNDLAFHPSDVRLYLVASNKGLLRSADNGSSWQTVWAEKVYDLEFKTDDSNIVYAVSGDQAENRCRFIRSTDAGANFSFSENGWYYSDDPDRVDHGARITVTPADPDRIYAVLIGNSKAGDNGYIGVYRSDDSGLSWMLPQGQVGGPYSDQHPNLMTLSNTNTLYQGFYNLGIAASHTDPDDLLIGGLNLWRSRDGAITYEALGGYQGSTSWIHPDQQEILVNGVDMWLANDGGINYSQDLFTTHEARNLGLTGSDFWGFDMGWNTDVMVGGRYHNGNTALSEFYPEGESLRLGGGEAPTGYINPGTGAAHFSDIQSIEIPDQLDGVIRSLPKLGLYPNESYFPSHSSELVFHPRYFGTLLLGKDNSLWISRNGGQQFELLHSFGTSSDQPLMQIELSRPDGQIIYVYQRTSFYGAALWKSDDFGQTWASLPIPTSGSQRAGAISMNPVNPEELVLTFGHQNNDGRKVFLTRDGGQTWENLTTAILDGQTVQTVLFQAGDQETIYLGTNHTVFYRIKGQADWVPFWEGLPTRIRANKLLPFYKVKKLRLATYGHGIWERDMVTDPPIQVQIMTAEAEIPCVNDTVYFDDYSIRPAETEWQWEFPGASFISDANARNPRVIYPSSGSYSARLSLITPQGTFEEVFDNAITVRDDCALDLVSGNALVFQEDGEMAVLPDLNLTSNTFTISAWIYPFGIQNDYTGIVMNDGQAAGFNFNGGNNSLGYHWPGGAWWWNSGLIVPPNEWSYVAMVAYPDSMVLYLNGVPSKHVAKLDPVYLGALRIASYQGWNGRYFSGMVDEVALWNRSLSREEIRINRHLIKNPSLDSGLVAYYQFNKEAGPALDKVAGRHAIVSGQGGRVESGIHVGDGEVDYISRSMEKQIIFPNTGIQITKEVNEMDQGPWVITRLNNDPVIQPGTINSRNGYWLINYYGDDQVFNTIPNLLFDSLPNIRAGERNENRRWELWMRPVHASASDQWFSQGNPSMIFPGEQGSVAFEYPPDLITEAQYYVSRDTSGLSFVNPVELRESISIYPNPVTSNSMLRITHGQEIINRVVLFDAQGRERLKIKGTDVISLSGLPSGWYIVEVETDRTLSRHRLLMIDN